MNVIVHLRSTWRLGVWDVVHMAKSFGRGGSCAVHKDNVQATSRTFAGTAESLAFIEI
jgi:hypothetical protein